MLYTRLNLILLCLILLIAVISCGEKKNSKNDYENYIIYDDPGKFGEKLKKDKLDKIKDDGSWVAIIDDELYTKDQFLGEIKNYYTMNYSKAEEILLIDDKNYNREILDEIIFGKLLYRQMKMSPRYLAGKYGKDMNDAFDKLIKVDVLFLLECWLPLRSKIDKISMLKEMSAACRMAKENEIKDKYKIEYNEELKKTYINSKTKDSHLDPRKDKENWIFRVKGEFSIPLRKVMIPNAVLDEIKLSFLDLGIQSFSPFDFELDPEKILEKSALKELIFFVAENDKRISEGEGKRFFNIIKYNRMANYYLSNEHLSQVSTPTQEEIIQYIEKNREKIEDRLRLTGLYKADEKIPDEDFENAAYKILSDEKMQKVRDGIQKEMFKSYNVRISKEYFKSIVDKEKE